MCTHTHTHTHTCRSRRRYIRMYTQTHTHTNTHHTHTQVDPDERTVSANEKPHFVKLCSGMPKEAGTGRPLSVAELTVSPVSACGHAKGGCQSNVRIY